MRLLAAILYRLLRSGLTIAALMAVLFAGYLGLAHLWPAVETHIRAPSELERLRDERERGQGELARHDRELEAERGRVERLRRHIEDEERLLRADLERDLRELHDAAAAQTARVRETIEDNRRRSAEAVRALHDEYCSPYNPMKWMSCYVVRQKAAEFEQNVERQREALAGAAQRLEANARDEARALEERAARELETRTAELRGELRDGLARLDDVEAEREALERRLDALLDEEQRLRERHWWVIELQARWPGLLVSALLIFFAPYLRRTLWYYVGMPLVSRAAPIRLTPPDAADTPRRGLLETSGAARTLAIDVAPGTSLRARRGYIQSDRTGARSELFFDPAAPNLSYVAGLVLLTRLDAAAHPDTPADGSTEVARPAGRTVQLGSPDDPDTYLMEIRLEDHPGIVLKARHIVAVTGDVRVRSAWRLFNWHAWATSQVRFLVFSGTGSIVVEGFGDVGTQHVAGPPSEKRMPLVIGFDTRLAYSTRRTATFLPYFVDPALEPLVVDVFEGDGAFFHQKNPTSAANPRRAGERAADYLFDGVKKLLGL